MAFYPSDIRHKTVKDFPFLYSAQEFGKARHMTLDRIQVMLEVRILIFLH